MIKFSNVSKKYKGGTLGLDGLDLEIQNGKVIGILGPNGSGKTTFLKLLNGYLKPTSGEITIFNEKIGPKTKSMVSYLPDMPFIPDDYTILEAKSLWKNFFDDFNENKFDELIEFMKLDQNARISELSKGMNEKFHLTLILSRDAKIYVIDEPISGVDLVSRDVILNAILKNVEKDRILVITTHLVDEMESLFDDVVFLSKGKKILEGNAEQLREEKGKTIAEIFKDIYGVLVY
ncbi:ABC transporter ATP-binding protein [Helcococcus ovis]|uniref:ABC transporter ATP-binding protein n=1 Tax=Helcococcus ovis TaxID=72026 RepID=A0A4R9C301_9FIRM|nr:ABC transporter ATP-binding protein [Helcococcus ovis]TFF65505.1 ABC transporter ATP-binding protein [Helcococcus ovis]TFF65743.1 ABC transporter ATP-binding protein [Helcococcus ovis]TFF68509.1 ABC transporter ATP-binding protein [Helcococcus ovis]WNZ01433.1 ABC transporter ATP-binding protein [Helcococcus ovis]